MSVSWAVRFNSASMEAALPLRLHRSIEYCRQGPDVFLRGEEDWEQIEKLVKQIPDAIRYRILADGQMVRQGCVIPEGPLPELPWAPLAAAFEFRPGMAAIPAKITRRAPIRIVRVDIESPAGALLTSMAEWAAYASSAPQLRLNALRFAAAKDGSALVVGIPLPPIRGEYLVEQEGLLVPCGYGWEPKVESKIVRAVLGLAAGDMALLLRDGGYELIRADSLVRASRSAARLSLERFEPAASQP